MRPSEPGFPLDPRAPRPAIAPAQALGEALLLPTPDRNTSLHHQVERECWKQHPANFNACAQPACVLLKRLARALGWSVDVNGVTPPGVTPPV